MINQILKKSGAKDKTDPEKLTEIRNGQRCNDKYVLEVDVGFEKLIVKAVRDQLEKGTDKDYTVLIIENLKMVYNDSELSVLYEMFKDGDKPIQRANDWCRPHLEGTLFDFVKKRFETKHEQP